MWGGGGEERGREEGGGGREKTRDGEQVKQKEESSSNRGSEAKRTLSQVHVGGDTAMVKRKEHCTCSCMTMCTPTCFPKPLEITRA